MTLKQLKAFLVLARTLNFANAASELHLSQSALSLTIKLLEEELGGKLFIRNTRRVELTQEGKSLIPYSQRLLANWIDMEDDLKQRFKLNRGSLVIASMPYLSHAVLPSVIKTFLQKHANINFSIHDITNENIWQKVQDGIFEIGLCFQPEEHESLDYFPLFEEDFVAIVPQHHALSDAEQLSWKKLLKYPFITVQKPSIVRMIIEQNCLMNHMELDLKVECHQIASICNLVAQGIGVSAIPRYFCHTLDTRYIQVVEIAKQNDCTSVGIVRRKNAEVSNITQQFMDVLMNYDFNLRH